MIKTATALVGADRGLIFRVDGSRNAGLAYYNWPDRPTAQDHELDPGLPGDPGHAIAGRQMDGFGAIVTFDLVAGLEAGSRFASRSDPLN